MMTLNSIFRATTLSLFGASLCTLSSIGFTANQEDISAVQNRIYDRHHEVSFRGGVMPNSAFFVNYPLSGSYTYHLNEWLGWELLRGTYYLNKSRALTNTLIEEYEVSPSQFDYPVYSLQSALVIKPTYGKDSWFNKTVLHHQSYFTFGGGLMGYQKEYIYDSPTTEINWSARIGVGRKYFISQNVALSLEVENHFAFKAEETEHFLQFNAGLDFRFNLSEPKSNSQSFESLYQFLEQE